MKFRFFLWLTAVALLTACSAGKQPGRYTGLLEGTEVQVPALIGGKVLQCRVQTGDVVQAGDTLAVLDTTELHLQWRQLAAKREELKAKRQIARANLQQAQADIAYLEKKVARLERLYRTQTTPKQSLEDLQQQLTRARTAKTTAEQNLRMFDALEEQLLAQMQTLRKKIRDAVIVSPADGAVTTVYYEAGEAAAPFSPVVEIIDTQRLEVKIYISERLLPRVKSGQRAFLYIDGLDDRLEGRVIWISPKAEFTPRTILTPETRSTLVYAVKITVDNPEGVLKHGMPVEVELEM